MKMYTKFSRSLRNGERTTRPPTLALVHFAPGVDNRAAALSDFRAGAHCPRHQTAEVLAMGKYDALSGHLRRQREASSK